MKNNWKIKNFEEKVFEVTKLWKWINNYTWNFWNKISASSSNFVRCFDGWKNFSTSTFEFPMTTRFHSTFKKLSDLIKIYEQLFSSSVWKNPMKLQMNATISWTDEHLVSCGLYRYQNSVERKLFACLCRHFTLLSVREKSWSSFLENARVCRRSLHSEWSDKMKVPQTENGKLFWCLMSDS